MKCIFCKIIFKKAPAEIIYETKDILVFKNIKPVAPVHLLLIPKKHILSVNHLKKEDKKLLGDLFLTAQKIAKQQRLTKKGYRLILNTGKDAGQTVNHLHLHLIGGKKLSWV